MLVTAKKLKGLYLRGNIFWFRYVVPWFQNNLSFTSRPSGAYDPLRFGFYKHLTQPGSRIGYLASAGAPIGQAKAYTSHRAADEAGALIEARAGPRRFAEGTPRFFASGSTYQW